MANAFFHVTVRPVNLDCLERLTDIVPQTAAESIKALVQRAMDSSLV